MERLSIFGLLGLLQIAFQEVGDAGEIHRDGCAQGVHAMVAAAEREGLELSQWLRQLALRAAGLLPGGR